MTAFPGTSATRKLGARQAMAYPSVKQASVLKDHPVFLPQGGDQVLRAIQGHDLAVIDDRNPVA